MSADCTKLPSSPSDLIPGVGSALSESGRTLALRRIHVHRNPLQSGRRRGNQIPPHFIFGEHEKIILIFYTKLQFQSPLKKSEPRTPTDSAYIFRDTPADPL